MTNDDGNLYCPATPEQIAAASLEALVAFEERMLYLGGEEINYGGDPSLYYTQRFAAEVELSRR